MASRVEQPEDGLHEGSVATAMRVGPVNAEANRQPPPTANGFANRMLHECKRLEREVEASTVIHGDAERVMDGPVEPESRCHKGRGWPMHGRPSAWRSERSGSALTSVRPIRSRDAQQKFFRGDSAIRSEEMQEAM